MPGNSPMQINDARVADIQNLHAGAALGQVGAATDDLHAQRRRCGIAGQQHRVLRVLSWHLRPNLPHKPSLQNRDFGS